MHEAQTIMSSTASNYDVARLFLGTALASLVCGLSYFTLPSFKAFTPAGIYYTLGLVLYAILMFASSYVEEEHNFWYWATSGWLLCLFFSNMRKEWYGKWIFHPAIMALAIHRITRRWNQTGQKYAGADDIVNSGVFHGSSSFLLWILIRLARHIARSLATFDTEQKVRSVEIDSTDQNRMFGTIAVLPLCGTAFIFKLAFTAKDAPELTAGISGGLMERVEMLELVGLARMVFAGLLLSGTWITFSEWTRSKRRARRGAQGNGGMLRSTLDARTATDNIAELAVAFFDLTTLFLLTQTKAQNIPLYLLFRLQYFFLSKLPSPFSLHQAYQYQHCSTSPQQR
jgi:ethanolaminephosphotransferase